MNANRHTHNLSVGGCSKTFHPSCLQCGIADMLRYSVSHFQIYHPSQHLFGDRNTLEWHSFNLFNAAKGAAYKVCGLSVHVVLCL